MNQRIKLLAEQATVFVADYDGQRWQIDPEKFAELIVLECAKIANQQFEAATGLDDRDSWAAAEIKKHFGVEE
jgi:hypothetical protein